MKHFSNFCVYCVDDVIGMNALTCNQHVIGFQNICNCSRIQGYYHVYAPIMTQRTHLYAYASLRHVNIGLA